MNLGVKIRQIRTLKGYSQENMADELGISQKAYSLIENNETKLDDLRLHKIAEILHVSVEDIEKFSSENIITQNNYDNSIGHSYGYIENLHQRNKDLLQKIEEQYEQRIKDLQKEISFLRSIVKGED